MTLTYFLLHFCFANYFTCSFQRIEYEDQHPEIRVIQYHKNEESDRFYIQYDGIILTKTRKVLK